MTHKPHTTKVLFLFYLKFDTLADLQLRKATEVVFVSVPNCITAKLTKENVLFIHWSSTYK